MEISRLSKAVVISSTAILAALSALLYLRTKFEITQGSSTNNTAAASGQHAANEFLEPDMNVGTRRTFLAGEFVIVRKVADLPIGMRSLYAMADPGERFEATDVLMDSTLPRRRLVFGGIAQNHAFIHYEQGGIAHTYVTVFFAWSRGTLRFVCGAAIVVALKLLQTYEVSRSTATSTQFTITAFTKTYNYKIMRLLEKSSQLAREYRTEVRVCPSGKSVDPKFLSSNGVLAHSRIAEEYTLARFPVPIW